MAVDLKKRIADLEEEVARLRSNQKGARTSLTNLRTRTRELILYLDKNEKKFQTKARPEFKRQIEQVRALLPKKS